MMGLNARILALPRAIKRLLALGIDAVICAATVYAAFYLRLGYWVDVRVAPFTPILASVAIGLPIFVSFGLYRAIFRHAGWAAILTIARAVGLYAIPFILIYTVIGIQSVPRTVGIIQPLLLFLCIAASRIFVRAYLGETYQALWRSSDIPRVLIYGAGSSGRQLANAIRGGHEMHLVGFVDDDPGLWGATINGIHVYNPATLDRVARSREVSDILLAIPSATRARRGEIVAKLRELNLHVRTLPSLLDMARGAISVSDLRELDIQDLLGRPPVPPDRELMLRNIKGRTILVTGAGGSIGSELCRQIVKSGPAKLLLVDTSEYALYAIHNELTRASESIALAPDCIVPILGSVIDERRMREVLFTWRPATIFHAAAYKHVPLVEHNPLEGVRNNVLGTLVMAQLAERHGCRNFVLISTDKAVRPTNVMGTTKRISEMILQALHSRGSNTVYSAVRFGNVLGSSGSVVPLFRQQVAAGGPITITHPDITRFFMTIPEASQLVLQAGAMAEGGDVFLLDMGEPVKIVDLARNIIELSGLTVQDENNPDGDIEIRVVGLRPGEKLFEELLIGDHAQPSEHPRILRSHESYLPWPELQAHLDELDHAIAHGDVLDMRNVIGTIVPEYTPNSPIVDHVACARENGPPVERAVNPERRSAAVSARGMAG
jgi:FlaA1/EpsC-like NDP-sugar epimerase